jgi:hypothetical protein
MLNKLAAATLAVVLLNVSVTPNALAQSCDRGCLEGWVDRYLDAVIDNDVSALPVTNDVRFTEDATPNPTAPTPRAA